MNGEYLFLITLLSASSVIMLYLGSQPSHTYIYGSVDSLKEKLRRSITDRMPDCCNELRKECFACAAGMLVQDFCTRHAGKYGCPKILHSSDSYEPNTKCRPSEINAKPILYRSNLNVWNRHAFLHSPKTNNFQNRKHWKPKCDKKCPYYKCELERRKISNNIKPLIQEWIKLTDKDGELNIITFNWAGSLIATSYRNETIMHWDTDVDFMIWAHDTEKIEDFMDKYNQRENNRFKIIVQPDWRCKYNSIDKGNRQYYNSSGSSVSTRPTNGINFVAPNARLVDRETHFHLDVWAMYAGDHSAIQGKNFEETTPTVNFLNYQYKQFERPIQDIFPLKTCYLEGIRSWCPTNPQNILNEEYGPTVSKPNHVLDEDTGCWVKPVKYKKYKTYSWKNCLKTENTTKQLFEQLVRVRDAFDEVSTDYVIGYGTLIGAIRDHSMNKNEVDNDFMVDEMQWKRNEQKIKMALLKRNLILFYDDIPRICDLSNTVYRSSKQPWLGGRYVPYTDIYTITMNYQYIDKKNGNNFKFDSWKTQYTNIDKEKFKIPSVYKTILDKKYGDWKNASNTHKKGWEWKNNI